MAKNKNSTEAQSAPEGTEDLEQVPGSEVQPGEQDQPDAEQQDSKQDEAEQDAPGPKDGFRTYRVVGEFVTIRTGRLRLSVAQAINRSHALGGIPANTKTLKDGDEFDVLRPIGFATGEVFGYDGELAESQAREVEEK